MTCPECGGMTVVIDTAKECDCVIRRRKCKVCELNFFTEEVQGPDELGKVLWNLKTRKPKKHK